MSANDTQVAGDHYGPGKDFQHWDMVRIFDLDYFQGQITKYILRWRKKHDTPAKRLQDLYKARHFLDKYIEIEEVKFKESPVQPDVCGHPTTGPGSPGYEERYYTAMSTGPMPPPGTWQEKYGKRE